MPTKNAAPDLPQRLIELQNKLVEARQSGDLLLQNGDTGFASAPSNIALIKYWGKEPGRLQIPLNSSISLVLGNFRSFTRVVVKGRFYPEGDPMDAEASLSTFLLGTNPSNIRCGVQVATEAQVAPAKLHHWLRLFRAGWADDIGFDIVSANNFPTACGLASSASGYAALVGAMADLIRPERFFSTQEVEYWLAEWARIGSGSATRSVVASGRFHCWERNDESQGGVGEDLKFTTTRALPAHSKLLSGMRHCVVVISKEEKHTKSSDGHGLANSSPLQRIRLAGIYGKKEKMVRALENGDFDVLRCIAEEDAIGMHAVMQTSASPVNYFTDLTADLVALFVRLRNACDAPALWTMDAGPNIHILFLPQALPMLHRFCNEGSIIAGQRLNVVTGAGDDEVGLQRGRASLQDLSSKKLLRELFDEGE